MNWWDVAVTAFKMPRNEPEEAECNRLTEHVIHLAQQQPDMTGLGMRRIIRDLFRQVAAKAIVAERVRIAARLERHAITLEQRVGVEPNRELYSLTYAQADRNMAVELRDSALLISEGR